FTYHMEQERANLRGTRGISLDKDGVTAFGDAVAALVAKRQKPKEITAPAPAPAPVPAQPPIEPIVIRKVLPEPSIAGLTSVIIVAHNAATTIERTVRLALNSSHEVE